MKIEKKVAGEERYDFSNVRKPDQYPNVDYDSYLFGFKHGYIMGMEGRQTTFPFHGIENEPSVMIGFFSGQWTGLNKFPPDIEIR